VDVMYVNCDKAGLAIHPWAMKQRIYTIGTLNDMYRYAPPAVLTSVRLDVYKLLSLGIKLMLTGLWQGQNYRFGMLHGICGLTSFRGKLNINQQRKFEEVYRELVVNKGEFRYIKP
jgi:basic membrane protein A